MRFITDDAKSQPQTKEPCMRVICAGLSRCATSSLQFALESDVLDMNPCMHMARVVPYTHRQELVYAAILEDNREKRHKILHQLFDGYSATTDFPGWVFTPDLMDMYPDAVIVLNQRESAQAWEQSMGNNIHFYRSWWFYIPCLLWKMDRLHYRNLKATYRLTGRRFGVGKIDYAAVYTRHCEWVREEARKRGRHVVEWRATDGWGPLCEALGKAVPSNAPPFPRTNDTAEMRRVKIFLLTRGLASWGFLFFCIWATWRYGYVLLKAVLMPI